MNTDTDTDTHTRTDTDLEDTGAVPAVEESREDGHEDRLEDTVEVRRNGALAAGVAGVSGLVALAYLVRALGSGGLVDWLVCAALAALTVAWALSWRDARTPLLVADRTGIRVRLGRTWHGLPWEQVEEVEHAPRRGLLRDGRLVAFPVDGEGVVAGLDATARRQAQAAERVHGAPFAVPLGLTTVVTGADDGLTAALLRLAPEPEMVVEVVPGDAEPVAAEQVADERDADDLTDTAERPGLRGRVIEPVAEPVTEPVSEPAPEPTVAVRVTERPAAPAAPAAPVPVTATSTPSPLREPVTARRAEVTRPVRVSPLPVPPDAERLRRDAHDYFAAGPDDTGVWRSTTVVIDELAGPAVDPVVGPQLTRAREALGLSIERLAERTRIRAHVIESIEVDDFTPCGGDFYARGHLRTLARVLGIDAAPLLAEYDERYSDAPIDARRVFEAELATGNEGAIRSLRGGPNWSVLVAAVMAVVLAWSVVRLVLDQPEAADDAPSLASDSAGLTSGRTSLSPPVPVVLTAEGGGAKVVVRDGAGTVLFKGDLAFGQSRTVKAAPPVRVQTSDGSLTVGLDGADAERMGRTGEPARGTFVPPSD